MLGRGVGDIVEVIVVGFILLPVLILEQLQGLLVLCGGGGGRCSYLCLRSCLRSGRASW